jgi:hypothetical protein
MKVFTAPLWLMQQFDGLKSENGLAAIKAIMDKHGRPIIGKAIISSPHFKLNTFATSPEGVSKPIIEWLEEIDYEPINTEEE